MKYEKVKLKDIARFNIENKKKSEKSFKYLDTGNITENKIDSLQKFSEFDKHPSRAKRKVKKHDIIFSMVRPNQRHYGYINNSTELVVSTGFTVITPQQDKVNSKFLYYILTTPNTVNFLHSLAEGGVSTYPTLNISDLENLEIELPDINNQKKIADILTSLDDKIELNNQMNQTLEEMAKVLYKQWFVDFEFPNENGKPYKSSGGEMVESELGLIPKGWEVKELGELHGYGVLVMGNSPKSETYNEDGIGLPLINGASDYNELEIKAKKYTSAPSRVCGKGDYIFGVRATIGNVKISDDKYAIGRGVGALTNIPNDKKAYMYFVLKNAFKQLELSATGSVYASISKPDLLTLKIFKVENSVIEQFSEISNVLFDKKHLLLDEQKELFEVKTNLLNKLL